MAIVSQSEFRANMAKLLDQVEDDSKELIVTRQRGKKTVVIISLDEYESWKETEYLLADPGNAQHLRQSISALDQGKGVEVEFAADGALVPVKRKQADAA